MILFLPKNVLHEYFFTLETDHLVHIHVTISYLSIMLSCHQSNKLMISIWMCSRHNIASTKVIVILHQPSVCATSILVKCKTLQCPVWLYYHSLEDIKNLYSNIFIQYTHWINVRIASLSSTQYVFAVLVTAMSTKSTIAKKNLKLKNKFHKK